MSVTAGTLLDGRVAYAQPADGYRTGLEPVLLAACVPARPGERVLEAGTGAGAGLLCLAARVPGVAARGVERDPGLAALAAANFAANGQAGLTALCADLLAWQDAAPFDHAFANPPWHAATGTPSPDPGRRAAKEACDGLLEAWALALARRLRPRGTLSLIVPAARLAAAMAALDAARCAEVALLPIHPRVAQEAKLVILQGSRLGRGPCRIWPGLVLHEGERFTAAAEAVLRRGEALPPGSAGRRE